MLSLFQCFNDISIDNNNHGSDNDEVYRSLVANSTNCTSNNGNYTNNNISTNTTNRGTTTHKNRTIECHIGEMVIDMSINSAIKFIDIINEAINIYTSNTNTNTNSIIVKGIIVNDSNFINFNSDIYDHINTTSNNTHKAVILFEYSYILTVLYSKRLMSLIFQFLHHNPHQLVNIIMVNKTLNTIVDNDSYWKIIEIPSSFCRVNDKLWAELRLAHGLPYKNLLRIRVVSMHTCRLRVFYGNLREPKKSSTLSFSCLEMPEDFGIVLKRNIIFVIGMGANGLLSQEVHRYISNAIPTSGRSAVVNQSPVFRNGEVVDMDYTKGAIIQIESIPRSRDHNFNTKKWLLRRSGDNRLTFIQFNHSDNSHPKNNEAIIFQKDSIIDRCNSYIVVIDYNQNDDERVIESFLESVYKNYISTFHSELPTLEKCSPILIMIGINTRTTIPFIDQYIDNVIFKIRKTFNSIIAKDNMNKIFASIYTISGMDNISIYSFSLLLL